MPSTKKPDCLAKPLLLLLFIQALILGNGSVFAQEWVSLFDGHTLKGWTQRGGKAKYEVKENTIVGKTVPNTPNSFLCTEKMYGDFELELDFKVHPELNSGVQIRSNSLKDYKNGRVHGYQVEIDPSERAWSGGIYDEGRRGWLNSLKDNNAARYAFKLNDWNHYRIVAVGDRIRTWINGVPAADLTDSMTPKGFIALQVHGVGGRKDEITVKWRNIRLRENPQTVPDDSTDPPAAPEKIFAEGVEVKKLADGFVFTEGAAVGPYQKIYFNDIPNSTTHVYDPKTNQASVYKKETGRANGLFWTANDKLVACEGGNRRLTISSNGNTKVLAASFEGKKLNSPNDLAFDTVGGIYFTDPRYGNRDDMEMEVEGVYYLNRSGKLSRVVKDMTRPNGVIFSPDFKTLYIADTSEKKVYSYDVVGEGKLANKKEFADAGSDGMSVDIYGNIYLTWQGSILVYNRDGKQIDQLKTPEAPANCVLAGDTLYVTARKGFYSIKTNSRGVQ